MTAPAPRFVVLDGGEGCGKSTQARLLAAYLTTRGVPVVRTLEPGDTPLGWRLRHLLLDDREVEMTPLAEALLFWADRAEHVARGIAPALEAGRWVVCARFSPSTFAYQAWAGGLDLEEFFRFDRLTRAPLLDLPGREAGEGLPDLTLLLDLDPQQGVTRKGLTAALGVVGDNFEARELDFHRRVREGYLEYARRLGPAAVVVDAARPADVVHRDILAHLGLED